VCREPTAWLGISDSNCRIRARTIHLKQRDNSLGCGSRRSRFSRLSCCVSHSCGNDFGSCSTRRCATENPVEPDVILHSTSPLNRACMVVTDTEPERLALLPRQRHWPPRGLGGAARCCECRAPSTNLAKYAAYYNEVRTHVSLGKDAPCTRAIERFGDMSPSDSWQAPPSIRSNLVFRSDRRGLRDRADPR
jgi:hypothetical protein